MGYGYGVACILSVLHNSLLKKVKKGGSLDLDKLNHDVLLAFVLNAIWDDPVLCMYDAIQVSLMLGLPTPGLSKHSTIVLVVNADPSMPNDKRDAFDRFVRLVSQKLCAHVQHLLEAETKMKEEKEEKEEKEKASIAAMLEGVRRRFESSMQRGV